MERLTVKSKTSTMNRYTLKRMCGFDREGEPIVEEDCYEHCEQMLDSGYCGDCAIKEAFNRLAAYEDTGLTPDEIKTLQKAQIPQKPILTTECKGFTNYILACECPNCHKDIIRAGWANYCYHCGQALDWQLQGKDGD